MLANDEPVQSVVFGDYGVLSRTRLLAAFP